jgi:hypothetical protein
VVVRVSSCPLGSAPPPHRCRGRRSVVTGHLRRSAPVRLVSRGTATGRVHSARDPSGADAHSPFGRSSNSEFFDVRRGESADPAPAFILVGLHRWPRRPGTEAVRPGPPMSERIPVRGHASRGHDNRSMDLVPIDRQCVAGVLRATTSRRVEGQSTYCLGLVRLRAPRSRAGHLRTPTDAQRRGSRSAPSRPSGQASAVVGPRERTTATNTVDVARHGTSEGTGESGRRRTLEPTRNVLVLTTRSVSPRSRSRYRRRPVVSCRPGPRRAPREHSCVVAPGLVRHFTNAKTVPSERCRRPSGCATHLRSIQPGQSRKYSGQLRDRRWRSEGSCCRMRSDTYEIHRQSGAARMPTNEIVALSSAPPHNMTSTFGHRVGPIIIVSCAVGAASNH